MKWQPFKLITFDVTGTLLKYRSSPAIEYSNILKKYDIEVRLSTLEYLINRNWMFMTKTHPNFGLNTGLGWENYWRIYAQNVFSRAFEIEKIAQSAPLGSIIDELMMTYSTGETFELQTGAIDLLEYLKKECILMGIISNYDPRIKTMIKNLDLSHYFEFILSSYEARIEKPDIRIFRIAESFACKDTNREQFLHVGDSYWLDFQGAKNAGWSACIMHSDKKIIEQYPHIRGCIFDDFVALNMFLKSGKENKNCITFK